MPLTDRALTRIDALRPGVQWLPAHHQRDRLHRLLVAGDFRPLFTGVANDTNGLGVVDRESIITLPWPRAIAESAQTLLWADTPAITSDNATLAAWLRDNGPALVEQLEAMTRELALTGFGVILAEGGQAAQRERDGLASRSAIPPTSASRRATCWRFPTLPTRKSRPCQTELRIVRIPREGMASVLTCAYSTGQIGAALEGPADAPAVMGCWAIGDGQSLLDGIAPLLRELCIRHTGAGAHD